MTSPKRYRKDSDCSYTLGATLTFELLRQKPEAVRAVYTHSALKKGDTADKLAALCASASIRPEQNDKAFNILSQKENCFVIGQFEKYPSALSGNMPHVLLVNPSDAGNLGTIIRCLAGFQAGNLAILRPAVDIFDPKTVRASMGAMFGINFAYYDTFEEYAYAFGGRSFYPFMLDGARSIHNVTFEPPYTLIFSNEATGLPPSYAALGQSVVIPHARTIDSLNLSSAVSIAVYEATKSIFDNFQYR
jgi:TrmH family RNA methyltransferase